MAAKMAQPCRWSPAMRPNVYVRLKGMMRMASISSQLVRPVGFSKGWAELALSGPPPLVPSSLMISCEAKGPRAMTCSAPCSVVAVAVPSNVWVTPCQTSTMAPTTARGRRMYSVERVTSTQKLPIDEALRRMRPRMRATATAMPAAADVKLRTAKPADWMRWLTSSPE